MKHFALIVMSAVFIFSVSAQAAKYDYLVKQTEFNCAGDNQTVVIKYDTSVTPLGPSNITLNGRNITGGLILEFDHADTKFKAPGFQMTLNARTDNKKSFNKTAFIGGKSVLLKCSKTGRFKWFQPRDDEEIEPPPAAPAGSAPANGRRR